MEHKELIEDGIYSCPLVLLSIKDKAILNTINDYFPYSIGIEIECGKSPNFELHNFLDIPNILEVNIDSNEQRFRIPNGLAGLICLYNICEELATNSEINPNSGHHYHVDMTNTYHLLSSDFISNNENWILKELDSWNYGGMYNVRRIEFSSSHHWVRFQREFKTAEFRIGNMTFDYSIIVKRLIHASSIIQRLNKQLVTIENITYIEPNFKELKSRIKYFKSNSKLQYLTNQLLSLKENLNIVSAEEQKQIVNNRIIKI